MEHLIELCHRFNSYLVGQCVHLQDLKLRRHVIVFSAEISEVLCKIGAIVNSDHNEAKFNRIERLSYALTSLAVNCNENNGIEAFIEVLETFVEKLVELPKNGDLDKLLSRQSGVFAYTSRLLALEEASTVESTATGYGSDVVNITSNVLPDTLSISSPMHENVSALITTSSSDLHEVLKRRVEVVRTLIISHELHHVKNIRKQGLLIELHYVKSCDLRALEAELDSLKVYLSGFTVECVLYDEPRELSLIRTHRTYSELSLALSHRRLFSCDKVPVRCGIPIFSDEILADGWTSEVLGTLGFIVRRIGQAPTCSIVTAAHNCRRNFEVLYGFLRGAGAVESMGWCSAHDITISDLPPHIIPTADCNNVSGQYCIGEDIFTDLVDGHLEDISVHPPPEGTDVYFKGAIHSARGKYIDSEVYRGISIHRCSFYSGNVGDSGSAVFYRNINGKYVVFGTLTALVGSWYVVTPLTNLFTKNPSNHFVPKYELV